MYITQTEWKNDYGGATAHSRSTGATAKLDRLQAAHLHEIKPLLSWCSLTSSIIDFSSGDNAMCAKDGSAIFSKRAVELKLSHEKFFKNPLNGKTLTIEKMQNLRLLPSKLHPESFVCPLTGKIIGPHSHVVMNRKSGTVYTMPGIVKMINSDSGDAIDYFTGESFCRADLVILHDPLQESINSLQTEEPSTNSNEHFPLPQSKRVKAAASSPSNNFTSIGGTSTIPIRLAPQTSNKTAISMIFHRKDQTIASVPIYFCTESAPYATRMILEEGGFLKKTESNLKVQSRVTKSLVNDKTGTIQLLIMSPLCIQSNSSFLGSTRQQDFGDTELTYTRDLFSGINSNDLIKEMHPSPALVKESTHFLYLNIKTRRITLCAEEEFTFMEASPDQVCIALIKRSNVNSDFDLKISALLCHESATSLTVSFVSSNAPSVSKASSDASRTSQSSTIKPENTRKLLSFRPNSAIFKKITDGTPENESRGHHSESTIGKYIQRKK